MALAAICVSRALVYNPTEKESRAHRNRQGRALTFANVGLAVAILRIARCGVV